MNRLQNLLANVGKPRATCGLSGERLDAGGTDLGVLDPARPAFGTLSLEPTKVRAV